MIPIDNICTWTNARIIKKSQEKHNSNAIFSSSSKTFINTCKMEDLFFTNCKTIIANFMLSLHSRDWNWIYLYTTVDRGKKKQTVEILWEMFI